MSLKNSVTPPGIDLGTVRLVAQRLNHYATPGPHYPEWVLYQIYYTTILKPVSLRPGLYILMQKEVTHNICHIVWKNLVE